jgi:hypothetical protein
MSEPQPKDDPFGYDEERVKKFNHRANYYTNFPKSYAPAGDEETQAYFANTIVGFYLDSIDDPERAIQLTNKEEKQHQAALALAELALGFLEGIPYDKLTAQYGDIPVVKKTGTLQASLSVATIGAQTAWDIIDPERTSIVKRNNKSDVVKNEVIRPAVDTFKDVDNLILDLFETKRLPNEWTAGALLFLFELRTSSAPIENKKKAHARIRDILKQRLREVSMMQPRNGEQFADQTFEKGAEFLKVVLNSPYDPSQETSPIELLAETEAKALPPRSTEINPAKLAQARADVLGHIGYVLTKLY